MAAARRNLPKGQVDPAASQAATIAHRLEGAQLAGARTQTLQHVAVPICRADLINPQAFLDAQALLPLRPPTGNSPVTLPQH